MILVRCVYPFQLEARTNGNRTQACSFHLTDLSALRDALLNRTVRVTALNNGNRLIGAHDSRLELSF